jgi:phage host-nuclease inhibitor protein Gam
LVLKVINERVSQTLKKNEDFKHEIHQLETEKTRERKRLVKDFGKLMRTWEEEIECIVFINEAVSEYCGNLRQAYEEKTQDLEDLKEFEVLVSNFRELLLKIQK